MEKEDASGAFEAVGGLQRFDGAIYDMRTDKAKASKIAVHYPEQDTARYCS